MDLVKKHFLSGIYVDEKNVVIEFSKIEPNCQDFEGAVDSIIDKMMDNVYKRAQVITLNKKKCDEL